MPMGNQPFGSIMTFLPCARAVALAGGLAILLAAPALATGVAPDPVALDGTMILPDPSLADGHILPAPTATAGVAQVSAAADGLLKDCSRRNPCAMPTPARDHVAVGQGRAVIEANPAPRHRRMLAGTPRLRS